ncbi:G-type lectin S-receptor-like serine/threonine-protein kinase LECRK3 [Solanum verrucosum]|uniref:G-type lectin S-receptor-like serine/threonine-protein kinase LECRK3 n=1 Tax=Solanum verrucosum TaxID=315347 RepID=UPI0020D0B809|nr:G-type lectin S-receptor-like serine/threonine-protein kinase LECRK3 [Solanum verrucosum]
MAVLLWLLILSAFHAVTLAQQRQFNITLGSSLTPTTNSSWFSPSRRFAFGFYEQTNGYAVGIYIVGMPNKTAVWTANRNSPVVPSNTVLLLTNDGRLIVKVGNQEISVINPSRAIASASLMDTGNFALYDSDRNVIWQSFDNPTNTLLPGQHISVGQELFSSASETDDSLGIFRLKMQDDGNLVQYPVNTADSAPYAYYASYTAGLGNNVSLNLDDDGLLYLFNSTNGLKNLTKGGYRRERTIIYMMKIDADGIFRVYSHSLNQQNSSTIWSSTNDGCDPKGLCGLNGFCTTIDAQAKCCERNFTTETCQLKENTSKYYDMRTVENTGWEDSTYVVLAVTTKEDCEQACLQDCNCEAASFKDKVCRKQRLPLRDGRRDQRNSNLALVKVGINVPNKELPDQKIEEIKGKKLRIDILIASITLTVFALLLEKVQKVGEVGARLPSVPESSDNSMASLCVSIR